MRQPLEHATCRELISSQSMLAVFAMASAVFLASGCANGPFKPAEASQLKTTAESQVPTAADIVAKAQALRGAGRHQDALMLLSKGLVEYPRDPQLRRETGALHEAMGAPDIAQEAYEAVLLNNPNDIAALEALGVLHLQAGRLGLAERNLQSAITLDHQRIRAISPMGKVDTDSPVLAYNGLGVIADRQGDHEQAAALFMTALQIEKSPLLYTNLGYSRFLGGNLGAAEWAYQQALLIDSEYQPALRNLAMLYAKRKNYERARTLLLRTDKKSAALIDLGRLARANEDNSVALQIFEQLAANGDDQNAFVMHQVEELRALLGKKLGPQNSYAVRARVLRVRDSNSLQGEVIGHLPEGTLVEVVEKRGDWSFIAISDGPFSPLKGWVYSRYLDASQI